jgi:hypothetical protein
LMCSPSAITTTVAPDNPTTITHRIWCEPQHDAAETSRSGP